MAQSRGRTLFFMFILMHNTYTITEVGNAFVMVVSAFSLNDKSIFRHRRSHRRNSRAEPLKAISPSSPSTSMDTDRYITTPNYQSSFLPTSEQWETFMNRMHERPAQANPKMQATSNATGTNVNATNYKIDLFWEQIKYEAETFVGQSEQQAGSQLYQGILSHASLMIDVCTIISHEIATELITATTLKDLFINILCSSGKNDEDTIRQDLYVVTVRDSSIGTAMEAILFHKGFHALVCYRVGHRLWQANRTGLAYYIQSTVSRIYAADIHPACRMGSGIYLRVGVGVVIGETAVLGNDVSIFEGVTLGGTGKESGDRHPKVGNGVVIFNSGAVLGNIHVGEGSIVSANSIVTKALPPLAIVSGVPAKLQSYRSLDNTFEYSNDDDDDLQRHLITKYYDRWCILHEERLSNVTTI